MFVQTRWTFFRHPLRWLIQKTEPEAPEWDRSTGAGCSGGASGQELSGARRVLGYKTYSCGVAVRLAALHASYDLRRIDDDVIVVFLVILGRRRYVVVRIIISPSFVQPCVGKKSNRNTRWYVRNAGRCCNSEEEGPTTSEGNLLASCNLHGTTSASVSD